MARPRDTVKWLRGFIGYANYPKPDVLRPENRLHTAENVWVGGTHGIGMRRYGMAWATGLDTVSWLVSAAALAYNRMYTMLIGSSNDGFFTGPTGAAAAYNVWSSTSVAGPMTHTAVIAHKAYLGPVSVAATRPTLVLTQIAQFPTPAVPTAANTGSGAYAATARYYRIQWVSTSAQYGRGPVSEAVSFTPSGTGTGVLLTRPSTDTSVTDWIVWGSADGVSYYKLSTVAYATTTYTDTAAPASYSGNDALPDPLLTVPFRSAGMPSADTLGTPSVANTGAGTYAATLRYYRVRFVEIIAGVVTRRSEPTVSVSFTPSGAGTAARVTKPAGSVDGSTHWELEVSLDDANFYVLATTVNSTTTYDDSAATSSYSANALSDVIGEYTPPPVCRAIGVDRDRVLFCGGYTGNLSRVYYTPVLGTSDVSDDERVPLDNYLDVEAQDDDEIMACVGPVGGSMFVFKHRSIFRLDRTGNATTPYEVTKVTEGLGCEGMDYVCLGPGTTGDDAMYFINTRGAYRYDVTSGMTRLNDDLASTWHADTDVQGRVVYYPTRDCILFGRYAYAIHSGGWSYQDWQGGDPSMQVSLRLQEVYDPLAHALIMPASAEATTDGLYACDLYDYKVTDTDDQDFTATLRLNRLTLAEATQRWRPVRMRAWGSGGTVRISSLTGATTTAVTSADVELGTDSDGIDVSEALRPGPVEFLGLQISDTRPRSNWSLEAIEVTGIPQEPIA